MPHGYEVMRDSFKKKGLPDKAAKKKAAMIWNSKHKSNPVTRAKHEAFCSFIKNFEEEHGIKRSDDVLHSYDDQIRNVSKDLGQEVHLVGGPVRDAIMGRKSKDTDMVTVGGLQNIHNKGWKNIKKDFPVFTHKDHPGVELALGRGEKKTGAGHSDFDWNEAPDLKTDLSRRDFTINAMAYHPDKGITDPHGGRQDIEKKTLRHVGAAFSDDALRTLRGARFSSQLDFNVDPDTVTQFTKTNNELKNVSKERVRGEVEKAMATKNPSRFFKTLGQSKSLGHWFPEIEKTVGVPAGPAIKHPEGDTFNHSMHAVDYAASKGHDAKTRMFALTHDLGKAETPKDQWPSHQGHEKITKPAADLVGRLGYGKSDVRDVETHGRHHMLPHAPKLRPGTVVDYYRGVKNIVGQHLDAVTADSNAKGLPDQGEPKSVTNLRGAFKAIKDTSIEPNTPVEKIKSKQAQAVKHHMREAFCNFMKMYKE
jgi:tRNA nucleotidyltransferase (CCA-adding enzyme)